MAAKAGSLTAIPVRFDQRAVKYSLFAKRHTLRNEDSQTPNGFTIFLLNVPSYCSKPLLLNIFKRFGPIKEVYIQSHPGPVDEKSYDIIPFSLEENEALKVAYVVFVSKDSVDKVMEFGSQQVAYFGDDSAKPLCGLRKWCQEYSKRYPKIEKLQEKVDEFVSSFHENEAKAQEEKASLTEADEEGWVTVTRGPAKETQKPKKLTKKEKKKKRAKELINFYQFQQREAKRDHIAELRKNSKTTRKE